MEKAFAKFIVLSFLMAATFGTANAQGFCFEGPDGKLYTPDGLPCPNVIATGVPFLRIVGDARSGAMGDAGIAISPDANAGQFNDSKLVFAKDKAGFSATYTPWLRSIGLNDVYLAYVSGYGKIDEFQTISGGLRFFSLGNITFTNESGEFQGEGRPNEFEIKGAYSRKLSDKLAAGIGAKFIYSNLAQDQFVGSTPVKAGLAGAADLSFTYQDKVDWVGQGGLLRIGGAITNIGSKISYTNQDNSRRDFIPTNLGLGAALEMELDDYNSFTFTTDINKLLVPTPCEIDCDTDGNGIPDFKELSPVQGIFTSFNDAPDGFPEEIQELAYSIGVEYWYDKQFALRAGYYNEHRNKGNRKFFTVGLGLKYNVFGLNFSYLVPTTNQRNPLDNTLRFSLLFDFSAFESDN